MRFKQNNNEEGGIDIIYSAFFVTIIIEV